MEANRFDEFRKALSQVWQTIREHHQITEQLMTTVDGLFWELAQRFPELDERRKEEGIETKLQQLQLQQPPNAEKTTAAQPPSVEKKKRVKKSKEDVKKILDASIKNNDAFKDYKDVEIKTNTKQDCIETLNLLSKALIDAKKRIVYFSALQGQVLHELKQVSKCTMNDLFKKTEYSLSQIYFLINLYKLVVNNTKLYHSDLPLSFFKDNMQTIKQICEEEGSFK